MLRFIVVFLLLANGFFYAWSNGYLSQWGWAASSQRESFRLNEQIEPERIKVIPPERQADKPSLLATTLDSSNATPSVTSTAKMSTTTPPPTVCLKAGAFNAKQSAAIKQALDNKLPEIRWRFETSTIPARWIVYMGKYPNNQARDVKKTQLDQIKVGYEVLTVGALEPGLSLGNYPTQAVANQALQDLIKKGVRTARVLQETPEQKGQSIVVPAIDGATRTKLNTVYASLASQLGNSPLDICK